MTVILLWIGRFIILFWIIRFAVSFLRGKPRGAAKPHNRQTGKSRRFNAEGKKVAEAEFKEL